jgi:hypothetical protein
MINIRGPGGGRSPLAGPLLACIAVSASLAPSGTAAAGLDRWRVSGLIASVARELQQPVAGVHVHFADPSDYLRAGDGRGGISVDLSTLVGRIGGELAAPLDFLRAMKISREAAFVLSQGEMATTLHALPERETLCVVFPRAAPLGLAQLASNLSGRNESERLVGQTFVAADFFRFLLYHEAAHCAEDAWHFRSAEFSAYDSYLAESRADAFAVLMHVRRTCDDNLPRFVAGLRQAGLHHRGDETHQTSAVIGPTLAFAMNLQMTRMLAGRTVAELLFAARVLVERHALGRETFARQGGATFKRRRQVVNMR